MDRDPAIQGRRIRRRRFAAAARLYDAALTAAERERDVPAQRQILHRIAAVNALRSSPEVTPRTQAAVDFVTDYDPSPPEPPDAAEAPAADSHDVAEASAEPSVPEVQSEEA